MSIICQSFYHKKISIKKKIGKNTCIFNIGFVAVNIMFSIVYAQQGVPSVIECDWIVIQDGCGMPEAIPLIIDAFIGVYIGILLHVVSHRSMTRAQLNTSKIQAVAERVESLIKTQHDWRRNQKSFALRSLKKNLDLVLENITGMNKAVTLLNEQKKSDISFSGVQRTGMISKLKSEESRKNRLIQTIRNTLIYSNDVLDPDFLGQLDDVCSKVNQMAIIEHDEIFEFEDFDNSRMMVEKVLSRIFIPESNKEPKKSPSDKENDLEN